MILSGLVCNIRVCNSFVIFRHGSESARDTHSAMLMSNPVVFVADEYTFFEKSITVYFLKKSITVYLFPKKYHSIPFFEKVYLFRWLQSCTGACHGSALVRT